MTTYQYNEYEYESHGSAWLIRIPILVFSGVVLLLLLLAIFVSLFQIQYRGRIMPNISAYGVDLSGMTLDEAAAALEARFALDNDRVFTFRDGDQVWQASATELGMDFDPSVIAQEAMDFAHSGNPMLDLIDQGLIWLNGKSLTPVIHYDQNNALSKLNEIAEQVNRLPNDATLTINGTDVQITPASLGRTVDVMATLARLDASITAQNSGGEILLVINETPPTVANVEEAAARARTALSGSILLVAEDGNGNPVGPWIATVDQIAALLRVSTTRTDAGEIRYDININTGAFQSYLDGLARGLIVPAENGRFHFNDSTRQLEVLQRARNGRTLNIAQTLSNMEAAIFNSNNRTVAMAFDYQLPPYHDNVTAAELGITEMVSSGISHYGGSTRARIENIITSAARFDGLIIAPGEIFSFNQFVGDISPEAGYVSSGVIFGGRTIQGVGGGVCQVSTTAFRAAFYAGFPIVERYAHGYRVGYYEHGDSEGVGMDAAIYTPDLDFRFLNDTDYHLLIETSIYPQNASVEFRFYSTNPGRQVVKRGPVVRDQVSPLPTNYEVNASFTAGQELQVDWAAEGAYVEVTRVILDANGNEIDSEIFASQYQPWGAIVQVAPGDPRGG